MICSPRLLIAGFASVLALVLSASALAAADSPHTDSSHTDAPRAAARLRLPTELDVSWQRHVRVTRGDALTVTGTVRDLSLLDTRPVDLEFRTNAGWMPLASTTTAIGGSFTLDVPTSWYTRMALRVAAPATETREGAVTRRTTLTVAPRYRPPGDAQDYALSHWRFDPCRTIDYRVNTMRMPAGAMTDVRRAVRLVGEGTGLTFRYAGSSQVVPLSGLGGADYTAPPRIQESTLLIGWATPGQVPALRGDIIGYGGPQSGAGQDAKGFYLAGSGQVVIDATQPLRAGFGKGYTRGEVLMHEIGHAVGLDHSVGPEEVMSYSALPVDRFGAGDLHGLRRVGLTSGCFVDAQSGAAQRSTTPATPATPATPTPQPLS